MADSGSLGTSTATVDIQPGDDVTCTFTNKKDATFTIVKVTDPADSGMDSFGFATASPGMSIFRLDTNADNAIYESQKTFTFSGTNYGSKSVTEGDTAGWSLTDITCDAADSGSLGSRTATVDVQPGDDVTCTFENSLEKGKIVVDKVTDPAGSTQSFEFTATYGTFSLTDAAAPNDSGALLPSSEAGNYSVTEDALPAGWTLDKVTCTGDDARVVSNTAIDLMAGETVTCTFENSLEKGKIVVDKVTDPAGSTQSFEFTATYGTFSLTDAAAPNDSGALLPSSEAGNYSVTEDALPAGWTLDKVTCTGDDARVVSNTAIDLMAGETVTCTFENSLEKGKIVVDKVTDPAGSTQSFEFTATYGTFSLTDAAAPNDSGALLPSSEAGNYSVTEDALPAGWTLDKVTCTGDDARVVSNTAIDLMAGETVTCTFENSLEKGKIVVDKVTDPAGSTQSFEFTATYGTFSLTDAAAPNDSGALLPSSEAGNYSVTEDALPTGWTLDKVTCTGDDARVVSNTAIDLMAGETVTCTFENVQDAKVRIVKEATPEGPTEFDFALTGFGDDTELTLVDNDIDDNFADYTFSVGEFGAKTITESVPEGWTLTEAMCSGVEEQSDAAGVSFDVAAGDEITCTFTNVQDATVRIVKEATPEGDTEFDFALTGFGDDTELTLVDNGLDDNFADYTFSVGEFGTKTITESVPDDWTLTSASCTGTDTAPTDDGVSFEVVAGDEITCTFTNVQGSSLTIVKVTDPAGSGTDAFDFTSIGTAMSDFTLDTNGGDDTNQSTQVFGFGPDDFGPKSVTEGATDGWTLTDVTCDDGSDQDPNTGSDATATVDIAAGVNITCTFTNTQDATVRIVKEADPQSEQLFDFVLTGSGTFGPALSLKDNGTDPNFEDYTFVAGEFGPKSITETVPDGWSLTDASCSGVDESEITDGVSFAVVAGDDIECTFTNVQDATLTIKKVTAPADAGDTTFGFTSTGDGMSNFTLDTNAGDATNPSEKAFTFDYTLFGEKSVTENAVAGWVLDGIVCEGAEDTGTSPTATVRDRRR